MVITISRNFLKGHPREGQQTFFVEKMIQWYWDTQAPKYHNVLEMLLELNGDKFHEYYLSRFIDSLDSSVNEWKGHTIRNGFRYKEGDKFSPRVWSGDPYKTPQIQILPDLTVKKAWFFGFQGGAFNLGGRVFDGEVESHWELLEQIAHNDGLETQEFLAWFKYPKSFDGQIICWNDRINYEY